MSRACQSCGVAIRFIQTPKGRWIPVNPGLVNGNDVLGATLVTGDGRILQGDQLRGATGFVPHWATCVSPELFRRKA